MIEEMLVAPVHPIMSVYRLPGGQLMSNGYIANFAQDVNQICKVLPHLPKDLPIIILSKKDQYNTDKEFKVNRIRVETVLKYLCTHNQQYIDNGITISVENLKVLPENEIPNDFETIEIKNDINENYNINTKNELQEDEHNSVYQTYVECEINSLSEDDKIRTKLKWPTINSMPINEFEYDGLSSLVFPKLFPKGAGDPTKKARLAFVSETDGFKHLLKFATKNSKNDFYYPFASHPRFKFHSYDRIRRFRTLAQCGVYLNKNPIDSEKSMDDLKNLKDPYEIECVMKRLTAYSSNITGSNAYWYKRRNELEATFEQKQAATIFWTFSYADLWWSCLHRLMPGEILFI